MSGTSAQMQRIPFATESAALDSPSESLERLVNFYVEQAPEGSRSPLILKSRPLLNTAYTLGLGPIHAMNSDLPGALYIVSGQALYLVTSSATIFMGLVGYASAASDVITIASGPSQFVICVPPNLYGANVGDTVVRPIPTTTDFIGASSVAYIDGFFVFTAHGDTSQFFSTALFNPTTTDALDFAFADAVPNVVRRVISHLDRLWFLGESAIEIWYDAGDTDFPFRRDVGGLIPYGVMSPKSATICDGSIFWLGVSGIVFRTKGYNAVRVSTTAIEKRINDYFAGSGTPSAYVQTAFSFVYAGHTFYVLTLQALGAPGMTLAYDCLTQRWLDLSTSANGVGGWLPSTAVLAGSVLLGDSTTGAVYTLTETGTTDAGNPVNSMAISPPLWGDTNRDFMARLEVETDMGGNPIYLDWTDDDGTTWKGGRQLSLAGRRAYTTRLGSFRERTMRLTTNGKSRIIAVDAALTQGNA